MDDREKVISNLSTALVNMHGCGRYTPEDVDELETAAWGALKLLEEQEPIKPTVSVDTWICSKCGHTLESQELIDDKENPQVLIHEQYNYCPNCGRKVKWDE